MFGAVHLEVMLIMRCVLHEFAKGTQGSSQQCLKTTHPFVSSQIVADGVDAISSDDRPWASSCTY